MKKEEIVAKITEIVEDILGDKPEPDEKIFSRGEMDSLDMLMVIVDIENEFNIVISDDEVTKISADELSIDELADRLLKTYKL